MSEPLRRRRVWKESHKEAELRAVRNPVAIGLIITAAAVAGCQSLSEENAGTSAPETVATAASTTPENATGKAAPATGSSDGGALSVSVALGKPGGKVMASLVRGPEGWANNDPVETFEIDAGTSPVSFGTDGLSPGRYGLKLFQDTDGDGKLSTNALGIPTEPYAFSNNAPGTFGPPGFDAAAFEIAAGSAASQDITLD